MTKDEAGLSHVILTVFVPLEVISQEAAAVLVFMAVDAEILPVATIRGIVAGIAVFVMDGQQFQIRAIELASAFGAYPAMDRQGARAIVLLLFTLAADHFFPEVVA